MLADRALPRPGKEYLNLVVHGTCCNDGGRVAAGRAKQPRGDEVPQHTSRSTPPELPPCFPPLICTSPCNAGNNAKWKMKNGGPSHQERCRGAWKVNTNYQGSTKNFPLLTLLPGSGPIHHCDPPGGSLFRLLWPWHFRRWGFASSQSG